MTTLFNLANKFSESLLLKDKTTHSLQERMIHVYEQKATFELLTCFSEARLLDTFKLTDFLKENWLRTRFSCVGYTARPNAPFTLLLCQAAKELAGDANGLDLLMPDIEAHNYEGNEQDYSSYVELSKIPLPQLLRTHIIGDGGNYLVPVAHIALLAEGILGRGEGTTWNMNPYYTTELNAEAAFLSPNEIGRLWQHSPESRALQQTMNELTHAQTEEPTLLSQLQTLYKQLSLNDAHGGAGSNNKAGEAVYSALLNFFTYYDKLLSNDAIAKSIPEDIKNELETLQNFASNKDATGNSCIGFRAEALKPLITTHSERLKSITLDLKQLSSTVETAQENYDTALALVRRPPATNNVVSDKLAFTNELIQWLNFTILLENPTDLNLFMRLPTKDMRIIIENPSIPIQLSKLVELDQVDLINLFTLGYELDNIQLVLDCLIKLDRNSHIFFSPQDLKQAFAVIADKQAILLAELLLVNEQMSHDVLRFLLGNKEESFKNQLLGHLPAIITGAKQLTDILGLLNETQRTTVINSLIHKLPAIITNGWRLTDILGLLSEMQRTAVMGSLKQNVPAIITNGWRLTDLLPLLDITERKAVIDSLIHNLPAIITNGYQLADLLPLLDITERKAVIDSLIHNLPVIITNGYQLAKILPQLNEAQCTTVMDLLKEHISAIIPDGWQLIDAFKDLNESQTRLVLMSIKNRLPWICFFDTKQFLKLWLLDTPPITPFNKAFNELWPTLIINTDRLWNVLSILESKRLRVLNQIASSANGLALLQTIPPHKLVTVIGEEGLKCIHLKQMLHQIKLKSDELLNAGALDKAADALRLYQTINDSFDTYQNSLKLKDDYTLFKNQCNTAITKAQDSTLKEHRGWKKIFANLLIAVASFGIAFIANNIRTGGKQFFFSINTDSENKTNQLKTALDTISSPRESPSLSR